MKIMTVIDAHLYLETKEVQPLVPNIFILMAIISAGVAFAGFKAMATNTMVSHWVTLLGFASLMVTLATFVWVKYKGIKQQKLIQGLRTIYRHNYLSDELLKLIFASNLIEDSVKAKVDVILDDKVHLTFNDILLLDYES